MLFHILIKKVVKSLFCFSREKNQTGWGKRKKWHLVYSLYYCQEILVVWLKEVSFKWKESLKRYNDVWFIRLFTQLSIPWVAGFTEAVHFQLDLLNMDLLSQNRASKSNINQNFLPSWQLWISSMFRWLQPPTTAATSQDNGLSGGSGVT